MKINGQDYRSVWMVGNTIHSIEQNKLPEEFKIITIDSLEDVANSISTMIIRGAPAIGAMGVFGLAQAIHNMDKPNEEKIIKVRDILFKTRPTAYDLQHGLDYVMSKILSESDPDAIKRIARDSAQSYVDASAEACRKIGVYGDTLIKDGDKLLTHCNAGALATVDYGTALSPMRIAHENGKNIFVFVDETRPRLQGAKLTAFELHQEGINHAVIADNAAGFYMARGEVDMVITGTDRVAANGDVANKIGTYEKAVVAHENGIPVYIAAPISTIDFTCPTGNDIPIEERDENEVLDVNGLRVASQGSSALNPAFDVTPAKYITGIITEQGIFNPGELKKINQGGDSDIG
ncbi:MAG: S-methyl-5-thioribose-1-phosphate isomerase [Candidatus Marinimicrobia bacterium]|nr:S-methyl-5-thioribose-1-phosphate isomerase [Candidatus Neomarinimicrobiota bacterium]MBL7010964.1 S-methyl-5-thioribose-1-phosphate isomerase [Candidatus Neomarinimicrobiota bacterium]MBL7031391.1 S-methyl-5-thioribose-1-phosphate isomerase [Candidatus Neomarinimicrobiota bacterium]